MAAGNGGSTPPLRPDSQKAKHLESLEQGTVVGRYVLLYRAGIGGMGVVYAAYDPELDRKIAVKLLHPKREGTEGRTRLLREAQAMARLSHPNVITVHDVGTWGDQVFLALEFVEGETLAEWLRREPRPWRQVLQVFVEAGRGLAAAHRAGVVHRDFKPGNVLLGSDGRTRVMDFGMARPRAAPGTRELAEVESSAPQPPGPEDVWEDRSRPDLPPSPFSTPVTRDGVVVGTLPYMAPEVPRNRGTDARSDQFSFCVALYEALYGQHPFSSPGGSTLDLIDRMLKGNVRPPPSGSPVPGWLESVLLRGLRTEPEERYESMDDLLQVLEETPRKRWRLTTLAAGLAAVLALLFGVPQLWNGEETGMAACEDGEKTLRQVWNEPRQDRIGGAFARVGAPFATDAWREARDTLEGFVEDWSRQHRDACEATYVREEQSEELLARRMLCLDRHLKELDALLDLFAEADREIVEEAVLAVQILPPPEECGEVEALLAAPRRPEDPEVRRAIGRAEADLAIAHALAASGKYADALERGRRVVEKADPLSYPALLADALVLTGEMNRWLGNTGEAADDLVEAMWAAEASREDRLAARAATQLVWLLGVDQQLFARAHYWARLAQAKLDRALGDVPQLQADLLDAEGVLLRVEGRYAESLDRHTRALELRRQAEQHSELRVATTSDYLAVTLGSMGRHQEAREHLDRALEIRLRDLGPDHPLLAGTHNNLGVELKHLDLPEAALEHQRIAHGIFERAFGPEHRFTVFALNNIANTLNELGRHTEAEQHLDSALEAVRGAEGEAAADPSLLSLTLVNQAGTLQHLGRDAEAVPLLRRALELDEKALGESHPYVADDLYELATSLLELGRAAEAVPLLERALAIRKDGEDEAKVEEIRSQLTRALERAGGASRS